ncbi:unnamed protein product [Peronospora belbahrii]|uniref:BAG domain-containing protein n=1 Tax=Peronospora belbahrii TaxID=622444 RepID=A0AAU9L6N1_9STRA|nr:unnamed protein product [Peronospora belbahrii]
METPTFHEKNRLQIIEQKVKEVQEKLTTRLPSQYQHLVAMVCGIKWRLQTLKPQDTGAVVKKMRLELGAFDYRAKEQAELLTQYLLDLDGVLSHGDADIKNTRKALVVFIQQQLLPKADAFKKRSAKLKQFGEDTLGRFERQTREVLMQSDSGAESDDLHVKALFDESEEESSESDEEEASEQGSSESDEEEEEREEEEEEVNEDEEMEEFADAKDDEPMASEAEAIDEAEAHDVGEADDEEDEGDKEQAAPLRKSPRLQSPVTPAPPNIDVNMLPVWRPYYQLQRRQDGIYLIARLNDIDPRNVRVQWNERNGVLRVSGFRLPTQKDIVMSRLSGAPTFGRFEIAEQFPRNMLNMEEATQQIVENGTLQIRMPYYVSRQPLHYHPASLFQPQDCFVW